MRDADGIIQSAVVTYTGFGEPGYSFLGILVDSDGAISRSPEHMEQIRKWAKSQKYSEILTGYREEDLLDFQDVGFEKKHIRLAMAV